MAVSGSLSRLLGRLRMRHLQLLALLGEHPNVAHCAKRMHVTQPTASKLLREIEDLLEITLFIRNRRGLEPTVAGRALTRRAAIIVDELGAAQVELALTQRGATGHLRLGVFPVAVPELLMRTREQVLLARPDLVISMHEGVEEGLLAPLSAGHLDCVLGRVVTNLLSTDLRHEVLYHEASVIVCGTDHPLVRARQADRLGWFARSEWCLPTLVGAPYNMVASLLTQEKLPPPRVTAETTSVFVTVELLKDNAMLSLLPATAAHQLAGAGLLVVVPVPLPASLYPVGVIYRQDGVRSPLVQVVIEAARQAAEGLQR